MCPFALLSAAGRRRTLPRYLSNPDQAMMPLLMEYVAMALNPRQSLTPERRLHDLLADAPGFGPVLQAFKTYLSEQPWAVYEVRRAFRARSDDMMRPANAVRSLRTLATGSRSEMLTVLRQQAIDRGAVLETSGGHHRAWILRRGLYYPCGEHTLIAAPAVVQDKANPHFDQVWATIHDTPTQLALIG